MGVFNSPYIYNKQVYSIESTLYGFYSLVARFWKTHPFAAVTRSFSKVLQLVNKNPYVALSVK